MSKSFSDRLTPGQIQNVLDALRLPWRPYLRKDGVWADIPPHETEHVGCFNSDLSINAETGAWADAYCNGHPNPEYDVDMRSRGDIVQLVAMLRWERVSPEYEIKAINWIKDILNMDTKTDVHSFNVEDAKRYGVECAVILYNMRFWLKKNRANGTNIHDGRVWTYNTRKAFAELFPYLSEDQVYRRLLKLEKDGIIVSGNYNEHKYDRTKWYSIDEPAYIV